MILLLVLLSGKARERILVVVRCAHLKWLCQFSSVQPLYSAPNSRSILGVLAAGQTLQTTPFQSDRRFFNGALAWRGNCSKPSAHWSNYNGPSAVARASAPGPSLAAIHHISLLIHIDYRAYRLISININSILLTHHFMLSHPLILTPSLVSSAYPASAVRPDLIQCFKHLSISIIISPSCILSYDIVRQALEKTHSGSALIYYGPHPKGVKTGRG